jgi:hypothetical protein
VSSEEIDRNERWACVQQSGRLNVDIRSRGHRHVGINALMIRNRLIATIKNDRNEPSRADDW